MSLVGIDIDFDSKIAEHLLVCINETKVKKMGVKPVVGAYEDADLSKKATDDPDSFHVWMMKLPSVDSEPLQEKTKQVEGIGIKIHTDPSGTYRITRYKTAVEKSVYNIRIRAGANRGKEGAEYLRKVKSKIELSSPIYAPYKDSFGNEYQTPIYLNVDMKAAMPAASTKQFESEIQIEVTHGTLAELVEKRLNLSAQLDTQINEQSLGNITL